MTETLQNELFEYLGQLIYAQENEFDDDLKEAITEKINAVNTLLGIK